MQGLLMTILADSVVGGALRGAVIGAVVGGVAGAVIYAVKKMGNKDKTGE